MMMMVTMMMIVTKVMMLREGLQAPDSHELGRLVHKYEGLPVSRKFMVPALY